MSLPSFWLDKPKLGWSTGVVVPLIFFFFFWYDRSPPFTVLDGYTPPEEVRPGEVAEFVIPVHRELSRDCSLTYSRYLVDSSFAQQTLDDNAQVTAKGIRLREEFSPGKLHIKVLIPQKGIVPGQAHMLTESRYRCLWNPTTWIWPIEVNFDWPFTILPPAPPNIIIVTKP